MSKINTIRRSSNETTVLEHGIIYTHDDEDGADYFRPSSAERGAAVLWADGVPCEPHSYGTWTSDELRVIAEHQETRSS